MWIGSQPRVRLAALPTPLDELARLRHALGGKASCPRILIKRDDLTGLAFGGSKARKLEFLIGDALHQGATVLVTSGAVQSNHARMTVAAACAMGLKTVLVLSSTLQSPALQGNLLLDYLLGAEVHFIPADDPMIATGQSEERKIQEVVQGLLQRGERPYVIPVGGSSPVGALGYVVATLELLSQLNALGEAPEHLYYACGSRGTQVGLTLGSRMYSAPYQLHGIAISGGDAEKSLRAQAVASEAAALIGVNAQFQVDEFKTDVQYIGDGYAIPSAACLEAIRLTARCEGILLDPVYTGKAMAGLIDHIRRGLIDPAETVIFLHTGGTPGLFAYSEHFSVGA